MVTKKIKTLLSASLIGIQLLLIFHIISGDYLLFFSHWKSLLTYFIGVGFCIGIFIYLIIISITFFLPKIKNKNPSLEAVLIINLMFFNLLIYISLVTFLKVSIAMCQHLLALIFVSLVAFHINNFFIKNSDSRSNDNHVVVMILDGLPAQFLQSYNKKRSFTPFDDIISKNSAIVFNNFKTSNYWTTGFFQTLYVANLQVSCAVALNFRVNQGRQYR